MTAIANAGRSGQSHDGRHVMTVNSGQPRRQLGRVTLLLAIVGGTAVLMLPSSEVAPTRSEAIPEETSWTAATGRTTSSAVVARTTSLVDRRPTASKATMGMMS